MGGVLTPCLAYKGSGSALGEALGNVGAVAAAGPWELLPFGVGVRTDTVLLICGATCAETGRLVIHVLRLFLN